MCRRSARQIDLNWPEMNLAGREKLCYAILVKIGIGNR